MLSDMTDIHSIRLSVQLARPGVTNVLNLLAPSRAPNVNQATSWTRTRRARVRPQGLIILPIVCIYIGCISRNDFILFVLYIVIYRMRSFYFEII